MIMTSCQHCGKPIPPWKRGDARFCKAACRVNFHIKHKDPPAVLKPRELATLRLSRLESGLLIDAMKPWEPTSGCWEGQYNALWWGSAYAKACAWNSNPPPLPPELLKARQEDRASAALRKRIERACKRLAALGLIQFRYGGHFGRHVIRCTSLGEKLVRLRRKEWAAAAEHVGSAF